MPRAAGAAALMALAAAGCASIDQVAEMVGAVGVATGQMTEEEAQSVVRTAQAAAKAAEDITPEQEYYIGRAVAATLLGRYRPLERSELIEYVNLIGQALAMASDRPETFGGYRFLVLDSDEINAFAARADGSSSQAGWCGCAARKTSWPPFWRTRSGTYSIATDCSPSARAG